MSGIVKRVIAESGLVGGGSAPNVTISIANTTVTPGQYGNASHIPQITINARGQITSATAIKHTTGLGAIFVDGQVLNTTSNTTVQFLAEPGTKISANAATNTITFGVESANISVGGQVDQVLAVNGLVATGNSSVISLGIANTTVTPGEFGSSSRIPRFTVNSRGQVTNVTELPFPIGLSAANVDGTILNFGSTPALELVSGTGINLIPDAANNKITVVNTTAEISGAVVITTLSELNSVTPTTGRQVLVLDTGEGQWGLYMWDGGNWEEIANEAKLIAPERKTETLEINAPASLVTESISIATLPAQCKIVSITVSVEDPFIGGQFPAEVEIMFEGVIIMSTSLSDLAVSGTYMAYPELFNAGPASTISATMYYNGATGGRLRVKITYV
jgi:hypothetical protein